MIPFALVVLASSGAAQISFTAAGAVTTGQGANGPVFADLDGDGILDMAVTTDGTGNQDLLEVYRGAGDGTFTPAGVVSLPSGSSPAGIAASDLDADGDVDLAVVLNSFNQAMALRNDGGFTFAMQPGVGTGGLKSRTIATGDMNGDGSLDFVVGNRDSNDVSVLINSGGVLTLVGAFSAGARPREVVVGDWDGDGASDVAVADHGSRRIAFLMGTGGGALGAPAFLNVPFGTRPNGLAAADMDGDGDLDVVAANGDRGNINQNFVSIFTNTGGSFSGPTNFLAGGLDSVDVLVADFDLDGTNDVAVTHLCSSTVTILRGLGGGALGVATMIATASMTSELAGGDLDGNGSIDLGVSRREAANVDIFLNDAASSGTPGTNYCTATPNSTATAAVMSASGSASVAMNNLAVTSSSMPQSSLGFFLTSRTTGFVPNSAGSSGNLCLGGSIGRYSSAVSSTGMAGQISLAINLAQLPTPTGFVSATAGETWHFQAWFRDSVMGNATSNFSDGLEVVLN